MWWRSNIIMLLLNFSHPLTGEQLEAARRLAQAAEVSVNTIPTQADPDAPFAPQATALAEAARLSPAEWQTEPIVVNLPAYNFLAAALLAELHGRMGYFPPVLRLRPVKDALPPRYEAAEIINLQALRDEARHRRAA
jgi:hypothetical protein